MKTLKPCARPSSSRGWYLTLSLVLIFSISAATFAPLALAADAAVIYLSNGADGGSPPVDPTSYMIGEHVTVLGNTNGLHRNGYEFAGWSVSSDTGPFETLLNPGDTFTIQEAGNIYLYAIWMPTFSVTYDGNNADSGIAPIDPSSPYPYASQVTVLGNTGWLARSGFAFIGWSENPNATYPDYVEGDMFYIAQDVTLYAVWEPIIEPPLPTDAYVVIRGLKIVEGGTLAFGQFNFGLFEGDSTEPLFEFCNDDFGNIEFPALVFGVDQVGSHTYYFRELGPAPDNWTLDPTVYRVEIEVINDGLGTLHAWVRYYDGNVQITGTPVFVNVFDDGGNGGNGGNGNGGGNGENGNGGNGTGTSPSTGDVVALLFPCTFLIGGFSALALRRRYP